MWSYLSFWCLYFLNLIPFHATFSIIHERLDKDNTYRILLLFSICCTSYTRFAKHIHSLTSAIKTSCLCQSQPKDIRRLPVASVKCPLLPKHYSFSQRIWFWLHNKFFLRQDAYKIETRVMKCQKMKRLAIELHFLIGN